MSREGYSNIVGNEDGKNIWWTTDMNCELPIKIGDTGASAQIKPETIPKCFARTAKLHG